MKPSVPLIVLSVGTVATLLVALMSAEDGVFDRVWAWASFLIMAALLSLAIVRERRRSRSD